MSIAPIAAVQAEQLVDRRSGDVLVDYDDVRRRDRRSTPRSGHSAERAARRFLERHGDPQRVARRTADGWRGWSTFTG